MGFEIPQGNGGMGVVQAAGFTFIVLVGITAGSDVTWASVVKVVRDQPQTFAAGLACQFVVMPFWGFFLSLVLPRADAYCNASSLALAVILPGCMPGGTTSNLLTVMIGGNVDLSVLMSFISNLCAIFMIPMMLLIWYAPRFSGNKFAVTIPYESIIAPFLLSFVGLFIGISCRRWGSLRMHRLVKKGSGGFSMAFFVATLGLIISSMISSGMSRHINTSFVITGLSFQPVGYLCGLFLAKFVFRCNLRNSLTVSIETGVQNWGLGIAIVTFAFDPVKDERIVSDLLLNGMMGPTLMYVIHSLWMIVLFRWMSPGISEKHAPDKLEKDEEASVGLEEVCDEREPECTEVKNIQVTV